MISTVWRLCVGTAGCQPGYGTMLSNFQQSLYWLLMVVGLLINSGCRESQPQVTQPDATLQADTAEIKPAESSTTSGRLSENVRERSNEASVIPSRAETVQTQNLESGIEESATGAQNESPASDTNAGTTETSLRPVKQQPKPTQEQLDRWTQPEYDPLQLLACRESEASGFVSHLAHTKDGRHFILAGTKITLWSVTGEAPEHVFLEMAENQTIKSLTVSPNGEWFAAGDSEGTIRIWNLSDRKELISKQLYPTGIIQIAVSLDSQELATISYGDEITIWSSDSLEQKHRFKADTNGLKRIEYMTPELLVAAGETTSSWNVGTGQHNTTLSSGRYNFTMARSPDGAQFLFGDREALQFWSVTEQKPEFSLQGGFATEELAAFSANAEFLATANGSSVRVWDIASQRLVQIMDAFGWPITGLSWLPETNVLVVASENGRTRIWGKSKDADALQLAPLHAAVTMPEQSSQVPAAPDQLLQSMDLRTFPRIADSVLSVSDAFSISYETATRPDEAMLFYRYQLDKAGWQEVAAAATTPNSFRFEKDGFMISASFYEAAESKTSVNVSFAGNYDLRLAPKFDKAQIEIVFENEDTVIYRTKADLPEIETTLLRKMHEAGWTAYSRLHSSHTENEDVRDLEFLRNGMVLRVYISRFPADPTSFSVQYSGFLTTNSIPVPVDSGFVEFDGATQPYLVATTTMTLIQSREFYEKELAAQGWLARDYGRSLRDDHYWLCYVRGQQDLTVVLQSLPTGRTLVRVGDGLENTSWQLAKPAPAVESGSETIGIEAADLPILNETKSAKYDSNDHSIEFSMDTMPLLKIAELYTKEFESSGWKQEGAGIKADDYVFLTFVRENAEIALRARTTDGKSMVIIGGDGLLWTKELPGGRKVISYETWLRINHHPASLDLLDQYQTEMRSIADTVRNAEKNE